MKKYISILIVITIIFTLMACKPSSTPTSSSGVKIGIVTGSLAKNPEEFRAAEALKSKYPDIIEHTTYPDNYSSKVEKTIESIVALSEIEGMKAIVICRAVEGCAEAIKEVKKSNKNMMFFLCSPYEDYTVVASLADVILSINPLEVGNVAIEQANKQGAKTFVYISNSKYMISDAVKRMRSNMEAKCVEYGITFIDKNITDPAIEGGLQVAQMEIADQMPLWIREYGKDTSFFLPHCEIQDQLIRIAVSGGTIISQQCCPSPLHGYPTALRLSISANKKEDMGFVIQAIKDKFVELKVDGSRYSTWPVPTNTIMLQTAVEYCKAWAEGSFTKKNDPEKLRAILDEIVKSTNSEASVTVTNYTPTGKSALSNYYLIMGEYIDFGIEK